MVLFFRIVVRLFVIGFGYILACVAAISFLVFAIFSWRQEYSDVAYASPEEELIATVVQTLFGLVSFGHLFFSAFLPSLTIILVSEAFSFRSFIFNVCAGGLVSAILLLTAEAYEEGLPPEQDWILALAAGFIGGLIYWLVAGRQAGGWRVRSVAHDVVVQ